jgi:hypothetical protein
MAVLPVNMGTALHLDICYYLPLLLEICEDTNVYKPGNKELCGAQ